MAQLSVSAGLFPWSGYRPEDGALTVARAAIQAVSQAENTLLSRLSPVTPAPKAQAVEWAIAQEAPKAPFRAPDLPPTPFYLQGADGSVYSIPSQRPIGVRSDREAGFALRQAAIMREFGQEAFQPSFTGLPSLTDTVSLMRRDSLDKLREASVTEARHDAVSVAQGVTSIGAPSSLSGPATISGPASVSGPLNSVSGPPLPLNRRRDSLGSGNVLAGDIDGPFDAADARALAQMDRAGGDRGFARTQDTLKTAYAAEDMQAAAYQQALQKSDAEFARDSMDQGRQDADRALAYSLDLADSARHAFDVEDGEIRYRLGVDIASSWEAAKQAGAQGFAGAGVPLHLQGTGAAGSVEIPAGVPQALLEGADGAGLADVFRPPSSVSGDAMPTAGVYPLDRPADALYAAPVTPSMPAAEPVHAAPPPATPATLKIEAENPVQTPLFQAREAERQGAGSSGAPHSVGLYAAALAPLSVGVSFTV